MNINNINNNETSSASRLNLDQTAALPQVCRWIESKHRRSRNGQRFDRSHQFVEPRAVGAQRRERLPRCANPAAQGSHSEQSISAAGTGSQQRVSQRTSRRRLAALAPQGGYGDNH